MANNTEQELRDQLDDLKIEAKYESHSGQYYLTSESIDKIMAWHEAEATRARIDELERINPTTEWTLSASARQSTIGERIAELKRQAKGGK